jgi:hypothetical protein
MWNNKEVLKLLKDINKEINLEILNKSLKEDIYGIFEAFKDTVKNKK